MEILPFTQEMIPDASALLALRHQRDRLARPELPSRFEEPAVAARAIQTVLEKPSASGFAALRAGKLVAYLVGETTVQPWARCGYVYLPGCALAEGENPQLLQDLYALLGDEWNRRGCFDHYVYLSAPDTQVVAAWFDLGFGKEREDALLEMRSLAIPQAEIPIGIEIRRAGKGDEQHLAALSDTIWRHQTRAPRWHPITPEETARQAEGWAQAVDSPDDLVFLAFEDGHAVGSLGFFVEEEVDGDMTVPPRCRYMTIAATRESARGHGIGTALTWHGLKQVSGSDDEFILTNWQSANLLAARFWRRFGFKPVAYRLARRVNAMIAWARG